MKKGVIIIAILAVVTGSSFLFLSETVQAQTSPTYERAIKNFFTKVKQKHTETAMKNLWEDNEWSGYFKEYSDIRTKKLLAIESENGDFKGYIKLGQKVIGDRYVYLYYMVLYEENPIGFTFELYKPDREWTFNGFSFDTKLTSKAVNAALEEIFESPEAE